MIRLIIDDGVQAGRTARLNQLAIALVVILLVESVATVRRATTASTSAPSASAARLRRLVFETLLRQDVHFFDQRETGEITTRLWADVPALQFVLGEELADAMRFSVFAVCGTGLLFYTSVPLTLLTLLAVPPIVIATSLLGRRVRTLSTDLQRAHADAGAAAAEVIGGIRTVRAFSRERAEADRYERQTARALEFARRKISVARRCSAAVSFIAGECAAVLAIWVGGHLIVSGRITTGALISFILYALLVARGFRNASRFVAESMRAIGATHWMFELVGATPQIPLEGGDRPEELEPSIALEGVRFRYPARPEVEALKGDRSADRARRGRRARRQVGIRQVDDVQPAAALLRSERRARLHRRPRRARARIRRAFRSHMATVMQDPTLFSRTIGENIAYGVGERRRDREIESAAELASADEFIDRLPGWLRRADRRSRRPAVWRPAAAAGDRARGPATPPHPDSRRGHERARRRSSSRSCSSRCGRSTIGRRR